MTHKTSQFAKDQAVSVLNDMESKLDKVDAEHLSKIYNHIKYRFLGVESFLKEVKEEWYQFSSKTHQPAEYVVNAEDIKIMSPEAEKWLKWWYTNKCIADPAIVEPGLGATIYVGSDSYAVTVESVKTNSKGIPFEIKVRHNEVRCKDYYAGDYEILPELTYLDSDVYTRRKNGNWYAKGTLSRDHGKCLVLGYQHHYMDPSF